MQGNKQLLIKIFQFKLKLESAPAIPLGLQSPKK